MTGLAVIDNAHMIKRPRHKAGGLMAHTAITAGGYMVTVFTQGNISIVAASTIAGDTLVIKFGPCKGAGIMADRAIL